MKRSKKIKLLQIFNLTAFVGMVVVNYLANAMPINGLTTGEVSENYSNLFTPAGITFSIWGLIYLLLAVFVIYQTRGFFNRSRKNFELVENLSLLFILSCIFNMSWIFTWHHLRPIVSLVLLVLMWVTLFAIYLKINNDLRRYNWFAVKLPFSLYLGWISVATIANLVVVLDYIEWSRWGMSEEIWTILLIAVVALIGYTFVRKNRDIFYGLVIIWALTGIIIKRVNFEPVYRNIIIAAGVGIFLVLLGIILVIKDRKGMI